MHDFYKSRCKAPCEYDGCPIFLKKIGTREYAEKCQRAIEIDAEVALLRMVKDSKGKMDIAPKFEEFKFRPENEKRIEYLKSICYPTVSDNLFYLWGLHGVGKTTALLCFTFKCLQIGLDAYYVTAEHLTDIYRWKETGADIKVEEDWLKFDEIADIERSRILCIDDICHERLTEFSTNALLPFLSWPGRKILLSGNISIKDPKFPYRDERVLDRLAAAVEIKLTGASYRRKP